MLEETEGLRVGIIQQFIPDLLSGQRLQVFIENNGRILLAGKEIRTEDIDGGGIGVEDISVLVDDDDDFRGVIKKKLIPLFPFLQRLAHAVRGLEVIEEFIEETGGVGLVLQGDIRKFQIEACDSC